LGIIVGVRKGMSRFKRYVSAGVLAGCLWLGGAGAARADETVVTIPTRPGVTETFTADIPASPAAAVVLLPGGEGEFSIGQDATGQVNIADTNFLIRTRQMFTQANIAFVLLDAPSDQPDGINEAFRKSPEHAADIAAVIAWLGQKVSAPVWLVGTSMGTISAAAGAIALQNKISGIVLTSTVSAVGRNSPGAGVSSLNLAAIRVPALVMDDTQDACPSSPPGNAAVIAAAMTASPRVKTVLIDGGDDPQSAPCQPLSYHGYFGVEGQAVAAIVDFIKTAP
jgi:hypothetical protein